ncbi:hypothetical protein Hte_002643 [Hypoxylon texense]
MASTRDPEIYDRLASILIRKVDVHTAVGREHLLARLAEKARVGHLEMVRRFLGRAAEPFQEAEPDLDHQGSRSLGDRLGHFGLGALPFLRSTPTTRASKRDAVHGVNATNVTKLMQVGGSAFGRELFFSAACQNVANVREPRRFRPLTFIYIVAKLPSGSHSSENIFMTTGAHHPLASQFNSYM